MPSQFVWKSFGRFTNWSQGLWQPPITFQESRRTFHHFTEGFSENDKSLRNVRNWNKETIKKLSPWFLSSLSVVLTGILTSLVLVNHLISYSTNSISKVRADTGMRLSLLELVFVVVYISFAILTVVLFHLSIPFGCAIVQIMNQIMKLDWKMNKWGFLDKSGYDSVGLLMLCFLMISNLIPILLSVFGVYEEVDVMFLFLTKFLKSSNGHQYQAVHSFSTIILRFFWSLITITEVWKQIGFYSLSCFLGLQIVSKAVEAKTRPIHQLLKRAEIMNDSPKYRLQLQWRFHQAYKIYRMLQIIIFSGINPTMIFFIPYFISLGLLLCILCDFTTISLHKQIGTALLIVMPSISFCVKFIILTLLPQACRVNDDAHTFIQGWNKIAPVNNSLSRRKLKALIPLRIYAGPFFFFKRSTKTTYLSVLMYYTVTAVISIKRR